MSVSEIKNRLHSAIDGINNKELLEAVLTIITSPATAPQYILNEEQIKILNEREEKYLNGETKTSTLEEFRSKMNDKHGL